jgi:hypothetical protein
MFQFVSSFRLLALCLADFKIYPNQQENGKTFGKKNTKIHQS